MAAPPYQKLFWGSYHKHTAHLTHAREHGAYLLLIGALWNNDGKLPADDETLAAYAKMSAKEWASVKPKLMRLFHISRGKLTQQRVTEDLAKYQSTSGKRKEAGKAGGIASAEKHKGNSAAIASRLPTKPEPESEPKKEGTPVVLFPPGEAGRQERRAAAPTRGSRLDPAWTPSRDHRVYAEGLGFSGPQIDRIAQDFRDYWCAKAGKDAAKVDWGLTWQGWARREADRNPPPAAQRQKQVDWC